MRAVAGAGTVEYGLEAVQLVVVLVEGELVDGPITGRPIAWQPITDMDQGQPAVELGVGGEALGDLDGLLLGVEQAFSMRWAVQSRTSARNCRTMAVRVLPLSVSRPVASAAARYASAAPSGP